MDGLTINQAAQRLGVSPDTVRRHIHLGLLTAEQKPRGRGYQWLVNLPLEPGDQPDRFRLEHQAREYDRLWTVVCDLRTMIATVSAELEARRQEVARLLSMLENAQPR